MSAPKRTGINTTTPTDRGSFDVVSTASSEWGIDNTKAGFIVQSETFDKEPVTDTTQGQKGCVVAQLDYDIHYTLVLNVIGNGTIPEEGDLDFTYPAWKNGGTEAKWRVSKVTYQGSYNDKKKYTINCERWANWPKQTSSSTQGGGNTQGGNTQGGTTTNP